MNTLEQIASILNFLSDTAGMHLINLQMECFDKVFTDSSGSLIHYVSILFLLTCSSWQNQIVKLTFPYADQRVVGSSC